MDYVDFYYTNILGYTPSDKTVIRKTQCIIDYLKDCGFSDKELIHIILDSAPSESLSYETLPDKLWQDSLIKRGYFYYHHILQITSKPPYYDFKSNKEIIDPFFLEIKIKFTLDDLVSYFYKLNIDNDLRNDKRDTAAMKSLLLRYDNLSVVESLDFVLSLIDYCKYSNDKISNVFDITKNEASVLEDLKKKVAEAKFAGKDKIICRK